MRSTGIVTTALSDLPATADMRARCADGRGTLAGLFFSEDEHDIEEAQQICRLCPRQRACLASATLRREQVGVWGGMVFQNGEPQQRRRRRGRPRKDLAG